VPIEHLRSKKVLGSIQDGSREFISLLVCICADGTAIPPGLIYQGESGDLQDVWLDDFDASSELAYFAVSKKGWTNEELGMSWLKKIFDRNTRDKAGNSRRLLIVDGHSSHVNLKFIDYCDRNRIILAIFPPHSTHRLQPLDVGIFSPLAKAVENILSSFESTGIHPINPQKVLAQVAKKTHSPQSSDTEPEETTPMSLRGVRRALKVVSKDNKVS